MKAMVHSPDSDTDFCDNATKVLQGYITIISINYLPRLRSTNIHRSNKRK